jgi:type IV pilus assembly protein PilF
VIAKFKFSFYLLVLAFVACSRFNITSSTSPSLAQAAEYNIQLGFAYLQAGDMTRAKEKFLRAHQQAPRSSAVKCAIAHFFGQIGELKQAEIYYLQAIALSPHAGAVHNNYGGFLCQQGRYQEAEKQFLKAVQDPHYLNTASAWENAGLCALQADQKKKAMHYFQKALRQDPQCTKSQRILKALKENCCDQVRL